MDLKEMMSTFTKVGSAVDIYRKDDLYLDVDQFESFTSHCVQDGKDILLLAEKMDDMDAIIVKAKQDGQRVIVRPVTVQDKIAYGEGVQIAKLEEHTASKIETVDGKPKKVGKIDGYIFKLVPFGS